MVALGDDTPVRGGAGRGDGGLRGGGDRDSDDEVRRILAKLDQLLRGERTTPVKIAPLHRAVCERWPEKSDRAIIAMRSQWSHVINDHPGQLTAEEVVGTVRNPTRIRRDKNYTGEDGGSLQVVYYRDRPDGTALLAVVDVRGRGLDNRLRTAFQAQPMELRRRLDMEALVWEE